MSKLNPEVYAGAKLFEADYNGYPCTVREVTDRRGETVVTAKGNVHARAGDYVALGVDDAPKGYGSATIARVIRRNDDALELGDEVETQVDDVRAERETLSGREASEHRNERPMRSKPVKATKSTTAADKDKDKDKLVP
jgi:hypothetical protein